MINYMMITIMMMMIRLPFMLENLGKPVIVTGCPDDYDQNDDNFIVLCFILEVMLMIKQILWILIITNMTAMSINCIAGSQIPAFETRSDGRENLVRCSFYHCLRVHS